MIFAVLTACGRGTNIKIADVNYLFSQAEFAVPGDYANVVGTAFRDGSFYILSSYTKDEGGGKYTAYFTLTKTDESGNVQLCKDISSYDLSGGDITIYSAFCVSADGRLFASKAAVNLTSDASGNTLPSFSTVITTFDEELNETLFFDIPAAVAKSPELSASGIYDSSNVNEFVIDRNGNIYIKTNEDILVFNTQSGDFLFSVTVDKSATNAYFEHLFLIDNSVYVSTRKYNIKDNDITLEDGLSHIDLNKKGFGESFDLTPATAAGTVLPGNTDYPVIIISGYEMYSFNPFTGEKSLLIDFLASGMSVSADKIMIAGEGKFAALQTEYQPITYHYTAKIITFNKLDPETVKPRELIEVYMLYRDPAFMDFAADFNKTRTDYQISVKSFYEDASGDMNVAADKMNAELLAGNLPDVMVITQTVPYDIYTSKGLFYDLNKYLEKDKDIDFSDLNKSVISALETDGKLYSITREFTLGGLLGKKEIIGDDVSLTIDKLYQITEQYPQADVFGRINREGFIQSVVAQRCSSFINKVTGEPNFNSPEFIRLLKWAKNLPEDFSDENNEIGMNYVNDNWIFSQVFIDDFRSYIMHSMVYGKPAAFTGYISPEHTGIDIRPSAEVAMMTGGNRDGAYAVIKAYLLEEPGDNAKLSIWNSVNEKSAEKAKLPKTAIDPVSGEIVEASNAYYLGNVRITIPDNTDEDNQVIFSAIENIGGVVRSDPALMRIIEEETSAYFAGAKTAEECAKLIQDRASTYIAETR